MNKANHEKPSKKSTGGSYHRAKMRRAEWKRRMVGGMVNTADGIWVQGPGPASSDSYRNGMAGACGKNYKRQ